MNQTHTAAAFGRLCVETFDFHPFSVCLRQPPSGGCVLKPLSSSRRMDDVSAAFGRLCVETLPIQGKQPRRRQPPSGGCVLKHQPDKRPRRKREQPPSGGCVLKLQSLTRLKARGDSRLRAAVC